MNYTNFEQSRELEKLGLNRETADMMYMFSENRFTKQITIDHEPTVRCDLPIESYDVPCWSVGALLDLMPVITTDAGYISTAELCKGLSCYWVRYPGLEIDEIMEEKSSIDACVTMVCWLLKNNYIEKKEE